MVEETRAIYRDQHLDVGSCRTALGSNANQLSDQEILEVRDLMYGLADILCGEIERVLSKGLELRDSGRCGQ